MIMYCYVAFLLCVTTLFAVVADEVPKECDKLGILFYEELGCKAEYDGKKCPSSFKCDERKTEPDSCHFGGRKYKIGDRIDDDLPYKSCYAGCFCSEINTIQCASVDCPEYLAGAPLNDTCYLSYDLGKCCSTGFKCELDKSVNCVYDGKSYNEGERFYPDDRCYECVCQKGFKGVLEGPYCERLRCNVEISNSDKIANNCAPIYSYGACCPAGYACPSNDEVIIRGKQDTAEKCKYGDKLLNIGDSFKKVAETIAETKERNCKCEVPPFVSCF